MMRILLWTLLIIVLIRFVSKAVSAFLGSARRHSETPPTPRQEIRNPSDDYPDVRDATYTDINDDRSS